MTILARESATYRTGRLLRSHPAVAPAAVGGFAFMVAIAFAWVPSVWFDEAATISATTRSLPQLLTLLGSVDAVHGAYYMLMHFWFELVGYSPFTLRLPSAVATGLAAGLVVILTRMLGGRKLALAAGITFCVLPRVTWMGTEGRSYALTVLLALATTVVFLRAWRLQDAPLATRARWWTLYAAIAAFSSLVFLYLALLVISHGVTVAYTLWSSRRRSDRGASSAFRSAVGWAISAGTVAVLVIPFARLVSQQSAQVSWIDPIGPGTLWGVLVSQWFNRSPWYAVVAWALIIAGVSLLARKRRRLRVSPAERTIEPSALSVLLPWLLVPTVGLIAASVLISPLYSARYVAFSAPAAAILMAVAIHALGKRWKVVTALGVLAALCLPMAIVQRLPEGKQQSSWSEVAGFIASERSGDASVAQAVIYGPVRQHRAATTRVIAYSYPAAFAGLVDVKLGTPAFETGQLWETRYPLDTVTGRLTGIDTVWLVTSDKQDWRPSVTRSLAELGYSLAEETGFTGVNVLRFER